MFLVERWANFRMHIYGKKEDIDRIGTESSINILNHPCDIDWMLGMTLGEKFNMLGVCILWYGLVWYPYNTTR